MWRAECETKYIIKDILIGKASEKTKKCRSVVQIEISE